MKSAAIFSILLSVCEACVHLRPNLCFEDYPQVTPQVARLLFVLKDEMSRGEIQAALGLRDRKSFRSRYLAPTLDAGLVEMTIPEKPNSRLQRYRLTEKGRKLFQELREKPTQ